MDFLTGNSIWVYLIIFLGKIVEISLDTLRIVLINKGKRLISSLLGFVVIMIWIYIVSSVIQDLSSDWMKGLVYAVAYALGNFLGMTLDQKLAIGLCSMQVIVRESEGYRLANVLREHGFGVTLVEGDSYNYKRHILIVHLKRKRIDEAMTIIEDTVEDAVTTVNDIKTVYGGFVRSR